MSAPQPPADHDPARESEGASQPDSGTGPASAGYDFHGEKLDFDPYRFGAPEPTSPVWRPPAAPSDDPTRPPAPGERWSPGDGDGGGGDVRPGDYWQGGGSQPRHGAVFPPAGYSPPPGGPGAPADGGRSPVDLGKGATPGGPSYPPAGYPPPRSAYPPPGAGGYPNPPQDAQRARGGNGLAVSGMVVGIVGLLLAITSWPGIVVGLVGLGLSIAGLVRARRGAPMKGLAITGIILSTLAIVIGSAVLAFYLSRLDLDCVRDANGNFEQAQECVK